MDAAIVSKYLGVDVMDEITKTVEQLEETGCRVLGSAWFESFDLDERTVTIGAQVIDQDGRAKRVSIVRNQTTITEH